jgi:hypothetical protein
MCRRYYKKQNELIKAYEETQDNVETEGDGANATNRVRHQAEILAKVSFFCNLVICSYQLCSFAVCSFMLF